MAVKAKKITQAANQIVGVIEDLGLSGEEIEKTIQNVLNALSVLHPNVEKIISGPTAPDFSTFSATSTLSSQVAMDAGNDAPSAKSYFDQKAPKIKWEELLVAASYCESFLEKKMATKEDLVEITKKAKRTFDEKNYARSLSVLRKRKFIDQDGDGISLTHLGEEFARQLPDRPAAKTASKPRKRKNESLPNGGAANSLSVPHDSFVNETEATENADQNDSPN